jgi:monoamine oxidase
MPGNEFDVAIVGAGAAGLAAAQRLTQAGKRVVLLEARDRLGGRIHTLRDPQFPLPVELGAEFIHGRDSETFHLLRAMNRSAYLADGDHFHLKNGRLGKCNDFWNELDKVLSKLDEIGGEKDMSFSEFVQNHCNSPALAEARDLAMSFVEGFDAARADRISAKSLAKAEEAAGDEPEGSSSYRLLDGYGSVIEHLLSGCAADKLTVQLRTAVRRIEWKRGRVRIGCGTPDGAPREPADAMAALITLPVGVLKAGTVNFDPDIPAKLEGAGRIEMGPVVKVILRFRSAFWEQRAMATASGKKLNNLAFMHSRESAVPTWWTYFPVRATVLVGWAGGPAAEKLSHRPADAIVAEALASLAQYTGIDAAELDQMLQAWHVADWQADPFARGAYSYVTVGNLSASKKLAEPIDATLFFAGEATASDGIGGTVDAALSSGRRAADEILGI